MHWRDALELVLSKVRPLPPHTVALDDALGLVLAEAITATEPVPPFTNSAMDGFALRAADLGAASPDAPARLGILGDLPAGAAVVPTVEPGQAVRIMTGATLPPGADCVVPVEETRLVDGQVVIGRVLAVGANVRAVGEDIRPGTQVLAPGTVLRPAELGVLASLGHTQVRVHPPVRVAVVTTGDELLPPGERPGPGQIRDSNSTTLAAQVRQQGGIPLPLPRIRDTRAALREALAAALAQADLILTSGGVSMGEYDHVKEVMAELGVRQLFWKVDQKPGHPLVFSLHDERLPLFGLPGNPVSTMVCFEEYVRPAMRSMQGHSLLHRPVRSATLREEYGRRRDGRTHFVRVTVREEESGRYVARLAGAQGSGILSTMARANGLALVAPDVERIPAGGLVPVQLTDLPEDH